MSTGQGVTALAECFLPNLMAFLGLVNFVLFLVAAVYDMVYISSGCR